MKPDLSNQVIAHINDEVQDRPRRTLDLGSILTPELGSLSPRRNEIAPKGPGRDAALIAYAERLRNSYKTNEGGLRDGMLKLGEAFRDGQTINISCFCRAGEACHADVVKIAIEKLGHGINGREAVVEKSQQTVVEHAIASRTNPRTQRAVNEILSVGRSEMLLAKLEDTEGRNRSEHASYFNGQSQFIRDLYERGAVVREGVLISPKESPSSAPPLAIATNEYAVKRLSTLLGESQAKKLAPQMVEYGMRIAGSSADRDTQIKVFNWIYRALEGRNAFLSSDERIPENEPKEERIERTLKEIAGLAEEMGRLEPSDRLELIDAHGERTTFEGHDRGDDALSLEKVYEEAIAQETETTAYEQREGGGSVHEFERVELRDTTLSRLASEMEKQDLDRWIDVRLPALDEALESGTPVDSILRVFQNDVYHAAKDGPAEKQSAIDDLRFASRYIEHQLKQPESRLRHFNARFREYAVMLERASSRDEVIDAASRVRLENAKLGFQWQTLPEKERAKIAPPLTSKEMQFLFTEGSPRHYTSEMTAAKLSYLSVGNDARTKTDALMRGEISPSQEAAQLIDSLESRLGRRHLKDSVAATRHFLHSLKTPNDELRYKNTFDHSEVYRKLPAAERDFVYQRAVLQKEELEARVFNTRTDAQVKLAPLIGDKETTESLSSIRNGIKADFVELVSTGSPMTSRELKDRMIEIVSDNIRRVSGQTPMHREIESLSVGLGERLSEMKSANDIYYSTRTPVKENPPRNRMDDRVDGRNMHTR